MNKYLVEPQTLNKINKCKHETQIQLPIAAQIKCKSMHEMFGDRTNQKYQADNENDELVTTELIWQRSSKDIKF